MCVCVCAGCGREKVHEGSLPRYSRTTTTKETANACVGGGERRLDFFFEYGKDYLIFDAILGHINQTGRK